MLPCPTTFCKNRDKTSPSQSFIIGGDYLGNVIREKLRQQGRNPVIVFFCNWDHARVENDGMRAKVKSDLIDDDKSLTTHVAAWVAKYKCF